MNFLSYGKENQPTEDYSMQTIIHVICKQGKGSLREAIAKDLLREDFGFKVLEQKRPGRQPGWMKIRGTSEGRQGTVNVKWEAGSSSLLCRVVNKGMGKPNLVVGDFIDYVLGRHRSRIRHITIWEK